MQCDMMYRDVNLHIKHDFSASACMLEQVKSVVQMECWNVLYVGMIKM